MEFVTTLLWRERTGSTTKVVLFFISSQWFQNMTHIETEASLTLLIIVLYYLALPPFNKCVSVWLLNADVIILCLQKKAADTFSVYGSDIYKHGITTSFKVAASESKNDGKADYNPLQPLNKD